MNFSDMFKNLFKTAETPAERYYIDFLEEFGKIIETLGVDSQLNRAAESCEKLNLVLSDTLYKSRNPDRWRENLVAGLSSVAVAARQMDIIVNQLCDDYNVTAFEIIDSVEAETETALNEIGVRNRGD